MTRNICFHFALVCCAHAMKKLITEQLPKMALLTLLLSGLALAQEKNTEPATQSAPESGQIAAQLGEKFTACYNNGEAERLANLFAEDGEFIDSEQVVYSGRENIQAEFAALFESVDNQKMELIVDSVRQVAEGVVIEDGHAWIQFDDERSTIVSQYCSVIVKQGDDWKIASLRDIKSEYASNADRLDALDWILGQWIDESEAGVVEYEFARSDDGSFILGSYVMRNKEEDDFAGSIRIGWCPVTKQYKSWTFDSEGGVAVGLWNAIDEGWMIKNSGTRSDGVAGSSTNYYQQVDENRIVWKSFDRHVGDERQPDVEVTLVRKPPVPGIRDKNQANETPEGAKENN